MSSEGFKFVNPAAEPLSWLKVLREISLLLAKADRDGKKVSSISTQGLVIEFAKPVVLGAEGLKEVGFQVKKLRARKSGGGSISVLLEPLTERDKALDDSGVTKGVQEEPIQRPVVRAHSEVNLQELRDTTAFREGVLELRAILAANGVSIEDIGARIGINFETVLLRLPIVTATTAREFLGMSRQNLNRILHDENFELGEKVDGQYCFTIEELALFRQIPRPAGGPRR